MHNFTITKREILVSIAIVCCMILLGILIAGSINNSLMARHQEYNTALQINADPELFSYGMRTNIGNAFVYGDLKAVDTVTYPEVGGEYSLIKKVKEKYTMHTRVVTKTRTVNGQAQTYTETETYWTWDKVDSWSQHCNKITFLGSEFDYGTIDFPSATYITTIKESSNIRYKYYGAACEAEGTIYAQLGDNTISNVRFYANKSIEDTIQSLESNVELVLFWIGWILLAGALVVGFYYIDNRWLEDNHSPTI